MDLINLIENSVHNVKEIVRDFSIINGMVIKSSSLESVSNIPLTILPSPFPESLFKNAVRIQKDFHVLFNKISRDYQTLFKILEKVIKSDDFVKHLWEIYSHIHKEGIKQSIFLGLVRSDYMIHVPHDHRASTDKMEQLLSKPGVSLKQIEFNLIASSFAGMAQSIVPFHKLNAKLVGLDHKDGVEMPYNNPADGFAKGLICAWKAYGTTNSVILFLVGSEERNIFDQRMLEHSIYTQNGNVRVIRRTFEQCIDDARLKSDHALYIGNDEVSVIYFRHGYTPQHFYNEKIWDVRLLMERSKAIKCPNINQMLVNTKLVQQAMTDYSLLRLYISDTASQDIMETFAGQHLLTDKEKVKEALNFPERFVLKPQREGGGNNYFDDALLTKLNEIKGTNERYEYVLMQRIYPASFENYVMKSDGDISKERLVSELGIYGVFLCGDNEIYANYQCGHILRSKPVTVNESGIAAGFGFVDSPFLILTS